MDMVECMDEDGITREAVIRLINKKDRLERELKQLKEILDLSSIGMDEPLVDAEGYPREEIDVYLIRHTRHKIICLQNDLKALMREIEEGLHAVHMSSPSYQQEESMQLESVADSTPIAKVNLVHPGSPASLSGLEVGDVIIQFGTVNDSNLKSLKDISAVVEHSVGRKIGLIVVRGDATLRLSLTPTPWSGRGLLGCNILPVESVDR